MILLLIEQDRVSLREFVSMEHGEKGTEETYKYVVVFIVMFWYGSVINENVFNICEIFTPI